MRLRVLFAILTVSSVILLVHSASPEPLYLELIFRLLNLLFRLREVLKEIMLLTQSLNTTVLKRNVTTTSALLMTTRVTSSAKLQPDIPFNSVSGSTSSAYSFTVVHGNAVTESDTVPGSVTFSGKQNISASMEISSKPFLRSSTSPVMPYTSSSDTPVSKGQHTVYGFPKSATIPTEHTRTFLASSTKNSNTLESTISHVFSTSPKENSSEDVNSSFTTTTNDLQINITSSVTGSSSNEGSYGSSNNNNKTTVTSTASSSMTTEKGSTNTSSGKSTGRQPDGSSATGLKGTGRRKRSQQPQVSLVLLTNLTKDALTKIQYSIEQNITFTELRKFKNYVEDVENEVQKVENYLRNVKNGTEQVNSITEITKLREQVEALLNKGSTFLRQQFESTVISSVHERVSPSSHGVWTDFVKDHRVIILLSALSIVGFLFLFLLCYTLFMRKRLQIIVDVLSGNDKNRCPDTSDELTLSYAQPRDEFNRFIHIRPPLVPAMYSEDTEHHRNLPKVLPSFYEPNSLPGESNPRIQRCGCRSHEHPMTHRGFEFGGNSLPRNSTTDLTYNDQCRRDTLSGRCSLHGKVSYPNVSTSYEELSSNTWRLQKYDPLSFYRKNR